MINDAPPAGTLAPASVRPPFVSTFQAGDIKRFIAAHFVMVENQGNCSYEQFSNAIISLFSQFKSSECSILFARNRKMLREIFPGIVHIPIKILAVRYYTVMNGSVPNWFMDSFDIELRGVCSVGATDSNERRVFTIVAAVPAPAPLLLLHPLPSPYYCDILQCEGGAS